MITLKRLPADYQILAIGSDPPKQPIRPDEIAEISLPPDLDLTREVILFGQVPMWVYGALISRCQNVPWIGCFAALEGEAVVVQSRVPERAPGEVVPIALKQSPCPAILIGGPPNSGKSVLSNALRQSLTQAAPQLQIYLHRANWDGEGNWSHEAQNRDLMNRLIREHERRIHEHPQASELLQPYFSYHTRAVRNLRRLADLVLVDVGGKIQPEKLPLLQQCTHYMIISRDPTQIPSWHEFCQPTLQPLSIIHSVRESQQITHQTEPWLEMTVGPWNAGETLTVPELIRDYILTQVY